MRKLNKNKVWIIAVFSLVILGGIGIRYFTLQAKEKKEREIQELTQKVSQLQEVLQEYPLAREEYTKRKIYVATAVNQEQLIKNLIENLDIEIQKQIVEGGEKEVEVNIDAMINIAINVCKTKAMYWNEKEIKIMKELTLGQLHPYIGDRQRPRTRKVIESAFNTGVANCKI